MEVDTLSGGEACPSINVMTDDIVHRAVAGLPLGSTKLLGKSVAMHNIIGHDVDAWASLAADQGVHLHLYGKGEARPGRKMGHWTRISR